MATTIPALSEVTDILDTDLILVTHSTGDSYKMSGVDFNKRFKAIIAPNETPTTLTGTPLKAGNTVRVYWKVALTANSGSTALSLSYNNVSYTVKVPRNGSLVNFIPFDLGNSVYVYLQAYTEVDFLYDGTNFVLLGNPVLISTANYSIYADGIKRVDEVVSNSKNMVTSGGVADAISNEVSARDTAIASAIDIPKDAVLHYSFDDVPDYPDGTADVRLIDNNTFQIQSTNYNFSPNTFVTTANDSGKLKVSTNSTSNRWFIYMPTQPLNKIVKFRFTITNIDANTNVSIRNGYNSIVGNFNAVGTYEITFVSDSTAQYPSIYFYVNGGLVTLVFDKIYIGNGSYTTPIIDNANGQNNATNNGGIATKGVSGKGVKCFPNKQVNISNFNFANDFTVSLWVNPENTTENQQGIIILKETSFNLRNGTSNTNKPTLIVYPDGVSTSFIILDDLLPVKWSHLVIVKNGTKLTTFLDSVKKTEFILTSANLMQTDSEMSLNVTSNTRTQSYDDLLIFDRALSENEVMALYLNKGNTSKYYSWADWKLNQMENVQTRTVETKGGDEETEEER